MNPEESKDFSRQDAIRSPKDGSSPGESRPGATGDLETHSAAVDSSLQSEGDEIQPGEFAECLELFDKIKEQRPECLADLAHEATGSMWLDGDGSHPRRIGRFEIREQLGQGGFGIVFAAYDPDLERDVALKVPRVEVLATEQTQQRFLREAKAVAALSHGNIATVHESGRVGPVCFIASQLYRGGTLAEYIKEKSPLNPRLAVEMTMALTDAVQHAHSRGILHRDLKPANVLLAERNTAGDLAAELRITDFGLAKLVDEADGATVEGVVLGTPPYTSPEQAEGKSTAVTTASDVYSLGVILYELLTGVVPLKKDSQLATLEAVRNEPPPSPRRLQPSLPRDLESVCLKCLEKDSRSRYQTAHELRQDLQRFREGGSVLARSASGFERVWKWARRRPATAALVASAVLFVVLISIISSVAYWQVSRAWAAESQRAEEVQQQATRRGENFNMAVEAVDTLLTRVGSISLLAEPRMEGVRRALLEDAVIFYQQFLSESGNDPDIQLEAAKVQQRLGELYYRLSQYQLAKDTLTASLQRFEQLASDSNSQTELLEHRAAAHEMLGRVFAAEEMFDPEIARDHFGKTIALRRRILEERDDLKAAASLAAAISAAGIVASNSDRTAEAKRLFEESIQLTTTRMLGLVGQKPDARGVQQMNHARIVLAQTRTNLARLQLTTSVSKALPIFVRALKSWRLVRREGDIAAIESEQALTELSYSRALMALGRNEEAGKLALQYLPVLQRLSVEFSSTRRYQHDYALALAQVAEVETENGRTDRAQTLLRTAIDKLDQLPREGTDKNRNLRTVVECRIALANTHLATNQMVPAREVYSAAIQALAELADVKPLASYHRIRMARLHRSAATVGLRLGKLDEAEQLLRRGLSMLAAGPNDQSVDDLFLESILRMSLGSLLHTGRKTAESEKEFARSHQIARQLVAGMPGDEVFQRHLALTIANSALARQERKEYGEAAAGYRETLEILRKLEKENASPARRSLADIGTIHFNVANLRKAQGQHAAAVESYKKSLAIRESLLERTPRSPLLRYELVRTRGNYANVLTLMDDHANSIKFREVELRVIQQLSKEFPSDPRFRASLAISASNMAFSMVAHPKHRQPRTAIRWGEIAVRTQPSAFAWRALGMAQFYAGDYRKAMAALGKALSMNLGRPDPMAGFYMAMCFWKSGQQTQARQWQARAEGQFIGPPSKSMARAREEARQLIQAKPD